MGTLSATELRLIRAVDISISFMAIKVWISAPTDTCYPVIIPTSVITTITRPTPLLTLNANELHAVGGAVLILHTGKTMRTHLRAILRLLPPACDTLNQQVFINAFTLAFRTGLLHALGVSLLVLHATMPWVKAHIRAVQIHPVPVDAPTQHVAVDTVAVAFRTGKWCAIGMGAVINTIRIKIPAIHI